MSNLHYVLEYNKNLFIVMALQESNFLDIQGESNNLQQETSPSERIWQAILTELNNLDQKQLNQAALTIKPKPPVFAAFQTIATIIGYQYHSWSQISKLIQSTLLKQLYSIKHLMLTNKVSDAQISTAFKYSDKCIDESNVYIRLANRILEYCQLYMKENDDKPPYFGENQNLMQEELRQIEQEIREKKQHLKKFLENAYAEEYSYPDTPEKYNVNLLDDDIPRNVPQQIKQITPSGKQAIQSGSPQHYLPKKNRNVYKCKLQISTHGSKPSVSPISKPSKLSRSVVGAEKDHNLDLSQQDIKKQIEEKEKEIKKLKQTENQLKWMVEREAKRIIREQESQQQAKDLRWAKEEALRKEQFSRQKDNLEKSFVKENKSFKYFLSSPRSQNASFISRNQRILTLEEETKVEELERIEDQYKSLCSVLNVTIKQKEQIENDVKLTKKAVVRKRKLRF